MPRRILYLSRWFPDPPDNGARLRAWGQLQALSQSNEVTLLSFREPDQAGEPSSALRRLCRRVDTIPRRPYEPQSRRALLGYLSPIPRSLVDTFSSAMLDAVNRAVGEGVDLVVAATLETAQYASAFCGLPALLDDLEVGAFEQQLHAASPLARARARLTWMKLARYLSTLLPRFSACLVASEREAGLISRVAPHYERVYQIDNAVDAEACAAVRVERHGDRLVFAGSVTYGPNLDAMQWFCERVLPRIRAEIPEVDLVVTGALPRKPLPPLPGARLLGRVDDVRAVVASAAVSLAPIRRGGGTRLKILEAMALSTPVVSTTKGAEGLGVVHGEHVLVGDDEHVFAAHVVRLLRDAALRQRLALAARGLIASRYDTQVVGRRFLELVDRFAPDRRAGAHA